MLTRLSSSSPELCLLFAYLVCTSHKSFEVHYFGIFVYIFDILHQVVCCFDINMKGYKPYMDLHKY